MSTIQLDLPFCKFLKTLPESNWNNDCCAVLWKNYVEMPSQCGDPTFYNNPLTTKNIHDVNISDGTVGIIRPDSRSKTTIDKATVSGVGTTVCIGPCSLIMLLI